MEDKLLEILDLLEKDLKDIDSAVKHITTSKEAAQSVVKSNEEFSQSIREHLKSLHRDLKELSVSLKGETDKVISNWNELSSKLADLTERLTKLTQYFESVNFPARLDKLDTSIATLQQGIQANQTLLNDIYRQIENRFEKSKEILSGLEKNTRTIKTISIIVLGLVSVIVVISIFSILG